MRITAGGDMSHRESDGADEELEVVTVGLKNEQKSSTEKMELISRIKEISYDLERTVPETGEYQKELMPIVGRIDAWTEGNNNESGEQIRVLRSEILWLLNDVKTGIGRNQRAIPDMRKHVVETLVNWHDFVGSPRTEGSRKNLRI